MGVIKLLITTSTKEIEFEYPSRNTVINLYRELCKNMGIRETWYFGLHFKENKQLVWIDTSKKKISMYKRWAQKLQFEVKFYPEDVANDLIEYKTIKYFFLQLRLYIATDQIYCPADTCVVLASYATQVKYGDYDSTVDISEENLLPDRLYKQHNMDRSTFLERIIGMWKKLKGLLREDAMMEYLKLCQNLEMFGVHFFNITNKKGTELLLGIYPLGLNIYKKEDKLNPVIMFPWSEIGKLNFSGRKFVINTLDKKGNNFVFFSSNGKINKRILNLGIGYHLLYVHRRKPDSLEIIELKENANFQRKTLQVQREKVQEEIRARELLEKKYQQEIRLLHTEVDRTHQQLENALDVIENLKKQLEDIEESKKMMERNQQELQSMLEQLQEVKNMEASERAKLEEEIQMKKLEVQKIQDAVEEKDKETARLKQEMEDVKKLQEELRLRELEEAERHQQEREELERLIAESKSALPESTPIHENLKEELQELQNQLEETRNDGMETVEDRIHRENIRDGRDKYKTLKEIRSGNTNRRVELFENI